MTIPLESARPPRRTLGARLGAAFRGAPAIRPWRSPAVWVTLGVIAVLMLAVDKPLTHAVQGLDPSIIRLAARISQAGDSKWYLVPTGIAVLVLLALRLSADGRVRRAVCLWLVQALGFVFVAIAASGILNDVVKVLVGRARPRMLSLEGFYGFSPPGLGSAFQSFPSGHANTLFALAVALALIVPRWRGWLFAIAGALALCRVGATAHYLSDVVAGAALGVATTIWLGDWFAARGWLLAPAPGGGLRLAAPGRLVRARLKRVARPIRADGAPARPGPGARPPGSRRSPGASAATGRSPRGG